MFKLIFKIIFKISIKFDLFERCYLSRAGHDVTGYALSLFTSSLQVLQILCTDFCVVRAIKTMEKAKKPVYRYCLVPKCKNTIRSTPDKIFFAVPRDAKTRKQWCKIMRRDEVSSTSCLHCCEDHFNVKEDTVNYVQYSIMKQQGDKIILRLKEGVVPHIFQCQKRNMAPPERKSAIKRQRSALVNEALSEYAVKSSNNLEICKPPQRSNYEAGPSTHIEGCDEYQARPSTSHINVSDNYEAVPSTSHIQVYENVETSHSDKAVQVNIKKKYRSVGVHVNLSMKNKDVALSPFSVSSKHIGTSPIKSAKTTASKRKLFADNPVDGISISSNSSTISHDYAPCSSSELSWVPDDSEDEKHFKNVMRSGMLAAIEKEPKMLLGLPKKSYHLVKLLSENIPLSAIDILITLKKVKLNESFSILALNFGYSQSTISRIFSKSIPLIAAKMKDLIVWPTPPEIYKNLPISFRARYANVVSIIDCLEIQIEKPSDAVNQSLTWSQYKKCNTLKYLISCTPDGLINFISDGYGGRATDVMIVQDCGYLECLPPNKAVMADRGFKDLTPLLETRKCTLIRPPSVSKSSSSTKDEVNQSKRIAALRIHVERVINRLREFHMLLPHACIDYNLIPIIDEVIIVACGLINMQGVLIKK